MHIKTDGIIIREQNIGESDRLVTILTREYGLVRAFVRGAKNIKSNKLSSTGLLCYSHFTLFRRKDSYIIDNAEPIEVFFNLRNDIVKLSLALYCAQVCEELAPKEDNAEGFLRLLLNSIHLLCKTDKNLLVVKSVMELRAMSKSGYMPNLLACNSCNEYESDIMYFNINDGTLFCDKCSSDIKNIKIPKSVVSAMRYIIYSDFKKIFDFNLSDDNLKLLNFITERYLIVQTQRSYKTLDFYYSVNGE